MTETVTRWETQEPISVSQPYRRTAFMPLHDYAEIFCICSYRGN